MEGLPVRQWRKFPAVVTTALPREYPTITNTRNLGWQELPMPRGSELYPPMSQALLRAARVGQVNRTKPTPPEDDKEPGEDDDAEGDIDTGYIAFKWSQVPKELEEPEMEFLAKRRKGLSSVHGTNIGTQGSVIQMRKVKVRRVNAEGSSYVWDVLVPKGTVVEGEIVESDEVATEAPAPGTVIDGVGIANAEGVVIAGDPVIPIPPRRRPPPPKRKAKGPGRGRKKRLAGVDSGAGASGPSLPLGAATESGTSLPDVTQRADRVEPGDRNEDAEMADESVFQDGEEGSDEDEDEGNEGDDMEDRDREEGELSPSPDMDAASSIDGLLGKPPSLIIAEPLKTTQTLDTSSLGVAQSQTSRELSSSPDLPLASEQVISVPEVTASPPLEMSLLPQSTSLLESVGSVEPNTIDDSTTKTIITAIAKLPDEHNQGEGMVTAHIAEADQKLHLGAGESDLFGSLERHLNEKS
ncbi:hypothetical protein MMC34_007928 [Xylographa carneopallida]|nr:hypothetical protein [Xylographa carneopallida]